MMKVDWKHLAMALAVLPFAVLLFAWIGFFNVGASSGHWKVTEWFLQLAMRSAIRTYALAVEEPARLPDAGIQPAAGHFARGCAVCHGAPGEPRSPSVLRMLPLPPDLTKTVGEWSNAELFRLVKHGIRFTGMPAWPTQARDDEVWAMVAFLRQLPRLDAQRYRELAYGTPVPGGAIPRPVSTLLAECARCHGSDGVGRSPLVPNLAGQSEAYLLASLDAYAKGDRPSGIMSVPAMAITQDERREIARYYAELRQAPGSPRAGGDVLAGARIVEQGQPARAVPACASCHRGEGRNPLYPALGGQSPDYVAAQLRLFRAGSRGGSRYAHLMEHIAKGLSDQDIEDVAAYYVQAPVAD